MCPRLTIYDLGNLRLRDAVLLREVSLVDPPGVLFSDRQHGFSGELGLGQRPTACLPSLMSHIEQVVPLRADPKVLGVHTGLVVARVAYNQARRVPACQLSGHPVGGDGTFADAEHPVPVGADTRGPLPAVSGTVNFGPEPFLGGQAAHSYLHVTSAAYSNQFKEATERITA